MSTSRDNKPRKNELQSDLWSVIEAQARLIRFLQRKVEELEAVA
jgi:hypothetical protein